MEATEQYFPVMLFIMLYKFDWGLGAQPKMKNCIFSGSFLSSNRMIVVIK